MAPCRNALTVALLTSGAFTQAFWVAPATPWLHGSRHFSKDVTAPLMATSETTNSNVPPPLTLEEISNKIKFEITDLDAGAYGLESKDVAYAVEIAKVDIPLGGGGIGLGLEELRRGQDGRGCVLVSSLPPEGNAAEAAGDDGKIRVGDMICYLGQEPRGMVRTEGLDFEQTMGALRRFLETGAPAITLVLKRLVFRASLDVSLSYTPGPDEESQGRKAWTQTLPMLAGSQLRKELLRAGLPVYSQDTLRFDQPYVTGNCGGEGICGTCLVQVLEGKELLNEKDEVEAMVTRKWGAANWRLSCRVIVGATNTPGTVRFKLMPQAPFTKKKP